MTLLFAYFYSQTFFDKRPLKLFTPLLVGVSLTTLILLTLAQARPIQASHPGGLLIDIQGASLAGIDQGSFCDSATNPFGSTPDGIWLPVVVTNTTSGGENYTYTGLQASLTAPNNIDNSDPIRFIGSLAPGESAQFFYFMDYRALRDLAGCQDTGPTIDTWYNEPYTITITSLDGSISGTGSAIFIDTFNSKRLLQANAGGSKVSDALGPGIVVGQVVTQEVVYQFGNTTGDQVIFQPTGNGSFPDECFRLVGSEITQSDTADIPVGTEDTLSFDGVFMGNNDQVTIEYQYLVLCNPGGETFTYPWAPQISGNDFKYNPVGFTTPAASPFPQPATDVVDIAKSVTPIFLPTGGTVTYTIEFANTFTQPIFITQITDTLDTGLIFGAVLNNLSDVNAANSVISPTFGSVGTLSWYGIAFPDPNASYEVPALSSINLIYTATVTSTEGIYNNVASARVGSSTIGPVTATVYVGAPVTDLGISKVSVPVPAVAGQPMTYTIVVTNGGPTDVAGATMTDTIPAVLSNVTWSCLASTGSDCITATGTGNNIDTTVNILVGGRLTYTVVGTLDAGTTGTITNTAVVTVPTNTTDINPDNNEDTDVNAPLSPVVDPGIVKTVDRETASPGDQVVFQVTVLNPASSTGDATQVVITDPLPPEVEMNSYSFSSLPSGLVTADQASSQTISLSDHPSGVTETVQDTVVLTAPVLPPTGQIDLIMTTTVKSWAHPDQPILNVATLEFAEGPPESDSAVVDVILSQPEDSENPEDSDDDDDSDNDDDETVNPPPPSSPPPASPTPSLPVVRLPETGNSNGNTASTFPPGLLFLVAIATAGFTIYYWQRVTED